MFKDFRLFLIRAIARVGLRPQLQNHIYPFPQHSHATHHTDRPPHETRMMAHFRMCILVVWTIVLRTRMIDRYVGKITTWHPNLAFLIHPSNCGLPLEDLQPRGLEGSGPGC